MPINYVKNVEDTCGRGRDWQPELNHTHTHTEQCGFNRKYNFCRITGTKLSAWLRCKPC